MDENARAQAYDAQYYAVQSGQRSEWQSPSGQRGYVEPGPVFRDSQGTCRRYTHTIYIDGRSNRAPAQPAASPTARGRSSADAVAGGRDGPGRRVSHGHPVKSAATRYRVTFGVRDAISSP